MHNGVRRVLAFEHDLVDTAHDLDSLVGDEIATQQSDELVAVVTAAVAVTGAEHAAEETDVALLGRLLGCSEQRTDLGFRIAGRATRSEHGGESGSDARPFHGGDCRVPTPTKTRRR